MKIHLTLLLLLSTIALNAQSITFGAATTLFTLDAGHWELSQPMIPRISSDARHVDFYGLTGSTYKKHTYTAGNYPSKDFLLFGDFNYIIDVRDYDGDGKDDILTDYDVFKQVGALSYQRFPFGNISYEVEGSLDYNGDGLLDVVITEKDFFSSLSALYVFKNKGNFQFEQVVVERNQRKISTVITADVDGNGKDDIITANNNDVFPFTVIFSNADGTFTTRNIRGNDTYFLNHTLSVVDMDKDGDLDLVAMDYEKGLWFFENKDGFQTTVKLKASSFDPLVNGLMVQCTDLNKDGWPEMIVGTLTAAKLTILVSKGTGPFEFDALAELGSVKGGTSDFSPKGKAITRMLHAIDINDDGKKDIVLTSTFDQKQVAWLNTSLISHTADAYRSLLTYPNPITNVLQLSNDRPMEAKIIDLAGQLIFQGLLPVSATLDVSQWQSGTYLLTTVQGDGTPATFKFIKQ